MPDLDEDKSIRSVLSCFAHLWPLTSLHSVHFEMPKSSNVHKSMILRGVEFPPPALDSADIQSTANRAQHTGRSFGGVPLHNDNRGYSSHNQNRYSNGPPRGNHRNGSINYGSRDSAPGSGPRGPGGQLNPENPFDQHFLAFLLGYTSRRRIG